MNTNKKNLGYGDIEKSELRDGDLVDELREMTDYKAQQEEMKIFLKEEMERMKREDEELRREEEYMKQQRQIDAQEEMDRIEREDEELRREEEYREQQRRRNVREETERLEFDRREEEYREQKEQIDMREEMDRIQRENEQSSGEVVQDDDEGVGEEEVNEMERIRRDVEELKKMQIGGEASSEDGPNSRTKGDELTKGNNNWIQTIQDFVQCGRDMEVLDICEWTGDKKLDDDSVVSVDSYALEKTMYRVDDHQNSPPTALYAAIGTQNWNIALRRLLDKPKEASVWVNNASVDGESIYRFLPLHIACLSGAPLLLVTLLLQTYPNAAKYNAMGKLPIHMACETLADHRIVFLLLNAWPESINVKDGDGNTPIEVASLREPCEERKRIVQILTKKMECTVVKTPSPLYAAIDSQHWNFAIKRLVEMPQEATVWVSFTTKRKEARFLPLHIACHLGAPYFLISDLVHAYPDAVRKKTTKGKLPLHIACDSHDDERVIKLLLKFWPESVFVKDDEGNKALHIVQAAEFSPERTAIVALLQKKYEHQDNVVYAPTKLFTLIEEKNWDVAVRMCLESQKDVSTWVGSCQKIEDAKLLPLHIACASRAPLILIAVLIQSFPEGAQRTTNTGKLPIHLACENHADHRIVSLLLHAYPDSCSCKDEKGDSPIQAALLSSPSAERTKIIETLMAFENKSESDLLQLPAEMAELNIFSPDQAIETIPGPEGKEIINNRKLSKKPKKSSNKNSKRSKKTQWGSSNQMFT